MSISSTIKMMRYQLRMTQLEFGKAVGMKQACISRVESGYGKPSLELVKSIVKLAKLKKIKIKLSDIFDE